MIKEKEVSVFVQKDEYAKRYSEVLGREVKNKKQFLSRPNFFLPNLIKKLRQYVIVVGKRKKWSFECTIKSLGD